MDLIMPRINPFILIEFTNQGQILPINAQPIAPGPQYQSLMQAKRTAIQSLFKQNQCLGDFDPGEVTDIASCPDQKTFQEILRDYDIIRENFQQELREILFSKEVKEEVADPEEEKQKIIAKKSVQLEDLLEETREIRTVDGVFTYKSLKILELYAFLRTNPILQEIPKFAPQYLDLPGNLKREIYNLRESISKERMGSTTIEDSLKKMESGETEKIETGVQKIKEQIMVIDIDQLSNLMKKNKNSEDVVRNQSGVVFIGVTGAGKSTTILGLLGHQMVEKVWEGQNWVTPKQLLDIPGIEYLIANPSSKSVTRNVTSISLPQNMIEGLYQKYLFVDTPGFNDTQGSTIELSNSQGAAAAIKALKEARFVVVLSGKDQGSRNTGIVQMIDILNSLFPNYSKVKQSINFIFNRYDQKEIKAMKGILTGIWANAPASTKDNPNMKDIINDLIMKTSSEKDVLVFRPIDKGPEYAKPFVTKILSSPEFSELEEYFSVTYGNTTKNNIQKQASQLKHLCIHYFEAGDMTVCQYFLSQLHRFYELLGRKEAPECIQIALKGIETRINQSLAKRYDNIILDFNMRVDTSTLVEKDVEKYMNSMKDLEHYKTLQPCIKLQDINSRMTANANDKITLVVDNIKKKADVDSKMIRSLKVLLQGFQKKNLLYDIIVYYKDRLEEKFKNYSLFIKEGKFQELEQSYVEYNEVYKNLSLFEEKDIPPNKINQVMTKEIDDKERSINDLMENFGNLEAEGFTRIRQVSNFFNEIQHAYSYLRAITNTKQVQQKLDDFDKNIKQKADSYLKKIQEYLGGRANLNEQVVKKISKLYKQRDQMRQISHLKGLVNDKSASIDNRIKTCLQLQRQIIQKSIDQLQKEKIVYNVLKREITRLDEAAKRMEKVLIFCDNDEENILDKTEEKLKEFFTDSIAAVKQINYDKLDLTSDSIHDQIKKLGEVLEILLAFNLSDSKQGKRMKKEEEELKKVAEVAKVKKVEEAGEIKEEVKGEVVEGVSAEMRGDSPSKPQKKQQMEKKEQSPTKSQIFPVNPNISERSKLFQNQQLIENFIQLKKDGEDVFTNNIEEIKKIVNKINTPGSKAQDRQPKHKLKEIESCLKFIEMGKKIFNTIPEKKQIFADTDKHISDEILVWEENIRKQVEDDFKKLRIEEIDTLKQTAKNLKKNIQVMNDISEGFPLIHKILSLNQRSFAEEEVPNKLLELTEYYEDAFSKEQKAEDAVVKLGRLMGKCKALSSLDSLSEPKYFFEKLQQSVKEMINEKSASLESKYKGALEGQDYTNVIEYLQKMRQSDSKHYEVSEINMYTKLDAEISKINQLKKQGFQLPAQVQKIIESLGQLVSVKNIIEKTKLKQTADFVKFTTKINEIVVSLKTKIQEFFNKLIKEISEHIKNKKIVEAHTNLIRLQMISDICAGTEISKEINTEKIQEMRTGISETIKNFHTKFIQKSNNITLENQAFVDQYERIFDKSDLKDKSFEALSETKKAIDKILYRKIADEDKRIELAQNLTKDQLSVCKEKFQKYIPSHFEKEKQRVLDKAKIKNDMYEADKKKSIEGSSSLDVFLKGGYINPQIEKYINDLEYDKTSKEGLLAKMKGVLNVKLADYQKNGLLNFLKQVTTCQHLKHPDKNKKADPVPQIIEVYNDYYAKINEKIGELLSKEIKDIDKLINDESQVEEAEIVTEYKQFITQSLDIIHIIYEKEKDFFLHQDSLRGAVEKQYRDFLNKVASLHKSSQSKCSIKKCFNLEGIPSSIQEIAKIKSIRIIENFVSFWLGKIQNAANHNDLTKILSDDLKELQKNFVIPTYSKIMQEQIISKHQKYSQFSLRSDVFYRMDQSEIKKELKDKKNYFDYVQQAVPLLYKAFNLPESQGERVTKSIEKARGSLRAEASKINTEISEFAENPSFQNGKVESIRKNGMILEEYCVFEDSYKGYKQNFDKHIQASYKTFYNALMEDTKKMTQHHHQSTIKMNDKEKLSEQNIQVFAKQQQGKLQFKLKEMEDEYQSQLVGLSEEDTLLKEKTHKGEIESEKNLCKEAIEQYKRKEAARLQKEKRVVEEEIVELFASFAADFEKIVTITSNLVNTKQNITSNEAIISEVNNVGGKKFLKYLVEGLSRIGSTVAGIIVRESKHLKKLSDTHFKKNIESLQLEEILDKLMEENKGMSSKLKDNLLKKFKAFDDRYKKSIEEYKINEKEQEKLIKQLKKGISETDSKEKNLASLAQIFALWTILTSEEDQGTKVYSYTPHVVQVITTILLLGITDVKECQDFKNRFAEIKTGQGKSLILAVLCTFFALSKYDVDCVCYSQNLSTRDKESFKLLFTTLSIENKINYCTFNNLTESFTSNSQISLREECRQLVKNKSLENKAGKIQEYRTKGNSRILLLDEADVFFIDEFYGNTYSPSIDLNSQRIKSLYNFIWSKNGEDMKDISIFEDSKEFKAVLDQFPQFSDLIKNHLPHMVHGMRNYKHDYQLLKGKIAYKDQDGFSDKISFGYKTIFAYIYEFNKESIPSLPLLASSIQLSLCDISYAQLPKMYNYIVGVTGTLKNLSSCKREIMQTEYGVEENYIIPSVYKSSKRQDDGYCIVSQETHFLEIVRNLELHAQNQRPVMIFFNNLHEAIRFYQEPKCQKYRKDMVIMNEKNNNQERKIRINRAMGMGKISLITKSFARGIDFIIYEKKVIDNGGAHLICAYVIEEKSQQVQILGRVGRQGDPASSIFIISEAELEDKLKIRIDKTTQKNAHRVQELIDKAREDRMKQKQLKLNETIKKCFKQHQQTINLFSLILSGQNITALNTIIDSNKLPSMLIQKPVKTVLAVDATGSMTEALAAAKMSLSESFTRIYEILKMNKVTSGFQMQIMAYRNYNMQEKDILSISPFETTPDPLVNFIKGVTAQGGWGNEALELVYSECLQIPDLKQIIIITDAKPNTNEEIVLKRDNKTHGYGEEYWAKTKFNKPADGQQLLDEVIKKNIIVNCLPIGSPEVVKHYQQLSKTGKGKCEQFDPASPTATQLLTDFISLSILDKLGESKELSSQLIESYKKTYKS